MKKLLITITSALILTASASVFAETNDDASINVSSFDYVIDNMTFWAGNIQVETLAEASSVSIDVTKRTFNPGNDKLIIAMYSDTENLIGMHTLEHTVEYGETSTLKIYMYVPDGVTVGEVKAFVWDNLVEMGSLSNSLSSKNNYIIEPDLEKHDDISVTLSLSNIENEDFIDSSEVLDETLFNGSYLKFYENDTVTNATKYLLDTNNTTLYVNNVAVSNRVSDIFNYVICNTTGDVTLVDSYKSDGLYDKIYVSVYETAMFDLLYSTTKIMFSDSINEITNIPINDNIDMHIYYNGEEISASELLENDILSIEYDVTAGETAKIAIANSDFYNIHVSRDVVSGTLNKKDANKEEIQIDNSWYKFISSIHFHSFNRTAFLGDYYTLYLDHLGRIYKSVLNSSNVNWAVIDKAVWSDNYEDLRLTLFTADGTEKTYTFDSNKAEVTKADGTIVTKNNTTTAAQVRTAVTALVGTSGCKTDITGRVIQYKVNSTSGKVTALKFMPVKTQTDDSATTNVVESAEFKARTNTIGSIKLGEATKIINAIAYISKCEDLEVAELSDLIDGAAYTAHAYGDKIDGYHPFVLVTKGEASYNARTRFAVVTNSGYTPFLDATTGIELYEISAMFGAETILIANENVSKDTLYNLNAGDVIFFTTDKNGHLDTIDVIFSFGSSVPVHAELAEMSLVDNNTDYSNLTNINIESAFSAGFSSDFTTDWNEKDSDAIKLIYGPVIDVTDYSITFGKILNQQTYLDDVSNIAEFYFAADVNVYTYNYANSSKHKFSCAAGLNELVPTYVSASYANNVIQWDLMLDDTYINHQYANFAFALVVGDEAVDIFEFIAE